MNRKELVFKVSVEVDETGAPCVFHREVNFLAGDNAAEMHALALSSLMKVYRQEKPPDFIQDLLALLGVEVSRHDKPEK